MRKKVTPAVRSTDEEREGHSHPHSHTKDDGKVEKVTVTPVAIHTAVRKPQALPTRVTGMVTSMRAVQKEQPPSTSSVGSYPHAQGDTCGYHPAQSNAMVWIDKDRRIL